MKLLTKEMVLEYMKQERIEIKPFEPRNFGNAFYYFRIGESIDFRESGSGKTTKVLLSEENPETELPAHSFAHISSMESFRCSRSVIAIFGGISEIAQRGLVLLHSPFIDATFEGTLDMGLSNLSGVPQRVSYYMRVGKAMFFDVSDSSPAQNIEAKSTGEKVTRKVTLDNLP